MDNPSRSEEAEAVARSHQSILDTSIEEHDDGGFSLHFRMRVQAPRDGRKNGVRDDEPIELTFPSAWPMKAPKLKLRKDFCRNIAHLNPSNDLDPQWIEPCIVDVPLENFIRAEGLPGLFNQLQEWLNNVAFDTLREKDGAWEPMRRDGLPIFAIGDETKLRSHVHHTPGSQLLYITIHPHPISRNDGGFFITLDALVGSSTVALSKLDKFQDMSVAMLTWGSEKNSVADIYPDGRCQLSDLINAAKLYRCNTFQRTIDDLAQKASKERNEFPVLVILAIRRPSPLAGTIGKQPSNIELLPYLVFVRPEKLHVGSKKTRYIAERNAPTYPVMLREKAGPELLQRISGTTYPDDQMISLLGCGSLGSKIAMHLGKTGFGRQHLVDKSAIMPHNLARMGVMIDHHLPHIAKVDSIEAELNMLGHTPTKSTDDIVTTASEIGRLDFPDDTALIIDTTASPNVHDTLCHYPIDPKMARIAQASYFAAGQVAVLSVEGEDRSIDIEHLYGCFWRHWAIHGGWPGGNLTRVDLGEGCGSLTMIMSDMQASLLAVGISQKIAHLLSSPIPGNGQLSIGVIDDDNCSVLWCSYDVTPVIVAETKEPWRVDVLPAVNDEIEIAVEHAGKNETGGYLLGRINWVLRRITITAQLPAPSDSKSSESDFVLGTEGAGEALQDLHIKSQKSFIACGTWHSHPKGGHESSTDLRTLEKLAREAVGLPMVSLIWRPEGYLALVKQDFSNGGNG